MLSAFDASTSQPPFMIEEEKPTVLWELTKMQDAWSMDSVGSSVIVGKCWSAKARGRLLTRDMAGGNQQIVYAQDVINPQFRSIRTPGNSDALSVCQINTVKPHLTHSLLLRLTPASSRRTKHSSAYVLQRSSIMTLGCLTARQSLPVWNWASPSADSSSWIKVERLEGASSHRVIHIRFV